MPNAFLPSTAFIPGAAVLARYPSPHAALALLWTGRTPAMWALLPFPLGLVQFVCSQSVVSSCDTP